MKIQDVDVSLSNGGLATKKIISALYFCIIILFLPLLGTISFIIATIVLGESWLIEAIIAFCILDLVSILVLSLCLWLLIRNKKLKQEITLWLEDAVELKAYSKRIGTLTPSLFIIKYAIIQVDFIFNDVKYSRISTGWSRNFKGYRYAFAKYADREINILYSPKYDQVLILKDKK